MIHKMIAKALRLTSVALVALSFTACTDIRINEHEEWQTVFEKHGIKEGAFEYYDNNKEIVNYSNKEMCSEKFSPASTFKIISSLIALETSVAKDEQMLIPFDGHKKFYINGQLITNPADSVKAFNRPEWNQDLNMSQAFKVSSVPYYQEIARRIGATTMQQYLDTLSYGNRNISGAIDEFWLNDTLKISPDEQVGIMKRLYHDQLPFSARTQRIVKGMMLQEQETDYKLYYKTGYGTDTKSGQDLLWVVGYAETIHRLKNPKTQKIEAIPHPYFFTLCFKAAPAAKNMTETRIEILHELLTKAGIHKY